MRYTVSSSFINQKHLLDLVIDHVFDPGASLLDDIEIVQDFLQYIIRSFSDFPLYVFVQSDMCIGIVRIHSPSDLVCAPLMAVH